jgi:hypothetical protein
METKARAQEDARGAYDRIEHMHPCGNYREVHRLPFGNFPRADMQTADIAPHRFDAKEYGDKEDNESQDLASPVTSAYARAEITACHRSEESDNAGQPQPNG